MNCMACLLGKKIVVIKLIWVVDQFIHQSVVVKNLPLPFSCTITYLIFITHSYNKCPTVMAN